MECRAVALREPQVGCWAAPSAPGTADKSTPTLLPTLHHASMVFLEFRRDQRVQLRRVEPNDERTKLRRVPFSVQQVDELEDLGRVGLRNPRPPVLLAASKDTVLDQTDDSPEGVTVTNPRKERARTSRASLAQQPVCFVQISDVHFEIGHSSLFCPVLGLSFDIHSAKRVRQRLAPDFETHGGSCCFRARTE